MIRFIFSLVASVFLIEGSVIGRRSAENEIRLESDSLKSIMEQPTSSPLFAEQSESSREFEEIREMMVESDVFPPTNATILTPSVDTKEEESVEEEAARLMNEMMSMSAENPPPTMDISWEVVQFLIMLTPTVGDDPVEIDWWRNVVEAVKCSVRSCSSFAPPIRRVKFPILTRHKRSECDCG